jgi:hypothetical protein
MDQAAEEGVQEPPPGYCGNPFDDLTRLCDTIRANGPLRAMPR